MNIRDKIIDGFTKAIEEAGLEVAHNWGSKDAGALRAYRPGSFEPLFAVQFVFGSDYVNGTISYPGERVIGFTPVTADGSYAEDRGFFQMYFSTPGHVSSFVDAVRREAGRFAATDNNRIEEAYIAAVEGAGTVEIADALVAFLKTQPASVRSGAAEVMEALVRQPSPQR